MTILLSISSLKLSLLPSILSEYTKFEPGEHLLLKLPRFPSLKAAFFWYADKRCCSTPWRVVLGCDQLLLQKTYRPLQMISESFDGLSHSHSTVWLSLRIDLLVNNSTKRTSCSSRGKSIRSCTISVPNGVAPFLPLKFSVLGMADIQSHSSIFIEGKKTFAPASWR